VIVIYTDLIDEVPESTAFILKVSLKGVYWFVTTAALVKLVGFESEIEA